MNGERAPRRLPPAVPVPLPLAQLALFHRRFDKAGFFGRIVQALAQPRYRGVQAMVEIDKRVYRPELQAQLLARDQFARTLQQHAQHAQGLFLEAHAPALLAQFSRAQVHFEVAEAQQRRKYIGRRHSILFHWTKTCHFWLARTALALTSPEVKSR